MASRPTPEARPRARRPDDTSAPHECGIVLHPAGHTRSPAMHRAAYKALGIDATYRAYDVSPPELEAAVADFRKRGLRQLAVSIPHKQTMIALVDEVEEVAAEIGAVNTVTRIGERLVATNTDWIGAMRALERETPVSGRRAVVLGAGGTARAVVYGLREGGAEVFVLNRTVAKAEALARSLGTEGAGALDRLADLRPEILVNTTSVGMNEMRSPVAAEALPEGVVVLDAVYAPEETQLLMDTRARGGRAIGGKWMLVHQAVEQLRRWTILLDEPPSEAELVAVTDVMAEAFDAAGR